MSLHWLPEVPDGYEIVPVARHWAQRELGAAGCSHRHVDRVGLVASEMVTNAVMHARGPFRFGIDATPRCTRIEVWDQCPEAEARQPGPGHRDTGGWGMAIVQRFSSRWGTTRTGTWKCTWSEVPAER
jgi:anti-sigma regulatory factor (Ser/Thr protein kinase)